MVLEQLLDAIEAAPEGPQVCACFDYDGTVISGFSAAKFYEHRLKNLELGPVELVKTIAASVEGIHDAEAFGAFLELSLGAWKGKTVEELDQLGTDLWLHAISAQVHPEAVRLITAHQRRGHTVVLASSATRFQTNPVAEELGIEEVLCTAVELDGEGRLTGLPLGAPLWGEEKASAFAAVAEAHGGDLGACFAYSNGREDAPLLEASGNPVAVSPDADLRERAEREGWPVLDCVRRGTRPSVMEIARTAGFYGGMAGALSTGIGLGLLNRSRKTAVDIATTVGADVSLALVGVDVEVVAGVEHLWGPRPCIFVFNHQSKLDPPIVMKLLRTEFTGVAKAAAKNVPIWGQLFQLAGVAFIERGDMKQTKKALAPAVARVREDRVSLAISPEGTRSPTPRMRPFKKGAFHIAMQAEVPMVPIVIRNSGELMWRGAQVIRSGTVEVAVLPPLDSSAWTPDGLDDVVADVRQQFVDTLADWPGPRRVLPAGAPS